MQEQIGLVIEALARCRFRSRICRSTRTLRETGGANVHPANWAPFVVVGEGARVHPGAR